MIRGAIILGVGFSLGYVKAVHDTEAIVDKLDRLIKVIEELGEKQQNEETEKTEADITAEAVDVTPETTPETPPIVTPTEGA